MPVMEREEWVIRHSQQDNEVREKLEEGENVGKVKGMKDRGEYGVQYDKIMQCSVVWCGVVYVLVWFVRFLPIVEGILVADR